MKFKTNQEKFWIGNFGEKYLKRNITNKKENRILTIGKNLINNNVILNNVLELGCNKGQNLNALKLIYPKIKTYGIDINKNAYLICKKKHNCYLKSLITFDTKKRFDLVFTSGVLIHQDPKNLNLIYSKMYKLTKKYLYISEYFSPYPVSLDYRGNKNQLFKRDFAKEIWEKYPSLKLINYGFNWRKDPLLEGNCDDNTWFLFEKKS